MEDKYLYMKTKNKCLPCLILDGNQYIFNCLNVDPVRKNDDERVHCSFGENTVQFVLYLDGILDEDCVINKDGVIEYHDPHSGAPTSAYYLTAACRSYPVSPLYCG